MGFFFSFIMLISNRLFQYPYCDSSFPWNPGLHWSSLHLLNPLPQSYTFFDELVIRIRSPSELLTSTSHSFSDHHFVLLLHLLLQFTLLHFVKTCNWLNALIFHHVSLSLLSISFLTSLDLVVHYYNHSHKNILSSILLFNIPAFSCLYADKQIIAGENHLRMTGFTSKFSFSTFR